MDLFNKCSSSLIGVGGKKCNCCFDFRSSRGKKKEFSKIRRARLKRFTRKYVTNYV